MEAALRSERLQSIFEVPRKSFVFSTKGFTNGVCTDVILQAISRINRGRSI